MTSIDFAAWVAAATQTPLREFRKATHIIIDAVTQAETLPDHLVMKGGMLISLIHGSDRHTTDIDFSAEASAAQLPPEQLKLELANALISSVEDSPYDLDCRIQSAELRPSKAGSSWQTYAIKIGYAPKTEPRRHRRLIAGNASNTVIVPFLGSRCGEARIQGSQRTPSLPPGIRYQPKSLLASRTRLAGAA